MANRFHVKDLVKLTKAGGMAADPKLQDSAVPAGTCGVVTSVLGETYKVQFSKQAPHEVDEEHLERVDKKDWIDPSA